MFHIVAARLGVGPSLHTVVLLFFAYSFLGYIMECIVLTAEKKEVVVNRGFARHMPFCIIYGFGALVGYMVLRPISHNLVLLFVVGALCATAFEFFVAQLQLRMFGDFWWDYTNKRFNYKGMLCLQSTLGWGIVALIIIRLLHGNLAQGLQRIPAQFAMPLAFLLVVAYVFDFFVSAREARYKKRIREQMENLAAPPEQEEITIH